MRGLRGTTCPECGGDVGQPRPFWRDGDFHYAWAAAAIVVPSALLHFPPGFVVNALYGPGLVGCWIVPCLVIAHLTLAIWLAGRGSGRWLEERVGVVLAIVIPFDGFALLMHWLYQFVGA
ncbi:MAG: hypothetical protein IT436_05800 [Phycisphaerales bacterium]|nr:hypothetical protein [Phycisphaerales bacterium]